MRRIAVVGAGPAGLTIAQELRRLGHDGEITMVGAEPYPP
ncbi:FAD-dependent oxidoreductase [Actinomadura nitritigenes]|uniref:FAD-dependent oxidoreductase n=1 Tax=Actinomadura nitritigenes TaxID=134602 RepID=A0ABS3RAH5_9ACTN|nr:FAD-dependent oxidoreductase [Actinomadura nitritigenes]